MDNPFAFVVLSIGATIALTAIFGHRSMSASDRSFMGVAACVMMGTGLFLSLAF